MTLIQRKPVASVFIGMLLIVGMAVGTGGCGKKLSNEARALIGAGALAAKERAVNFDNIKGQLKARDAAEGAALAKYLDLHGEGLNAQAAALADVVAGLNDGGKPYEQLLKHLRGEAETARARSKVWAQAALNISPDDEKQKSFIKTHGLALVSQADVLDAIAKLLPPPKPSEQ